MGMKYKDPFANLLRETFCMFIPPKKVESAAEKQRRRDLESISSNNYCVVSCYSERKHNWM